MSYTAEDDRYHERSDDPYWNESTWFSISLPEHGIEGYIYNWHRPNLGMCCVGPTFWDANTTAIEDALYHDVHWLQHIPDGEMMNARYPGGLQVERLEPGRKFRFVYNQADCAFDLTFEAFREPHGALGAHFEQPGRMRGELNLGGKSYQVDCWAMRDRSWGPRDFTPFTPQGDYLWGIESENSAFHAMSLWDGTSNRILDGYVLRDGEIADLKEGRTWCEGHRISNATSPACIQAEKVFIEGKDTLGREFFVEGRLRNTMIWTMYPRMTCALGMVEWTLNGNRCFGEQQAFWPTTVARDLIRKLTSD